MENIAWALVALAAALILYAYAGYPLILAVLARLRPPRPVPAIFPGDWPEVTISVPVYNEARQIRDLLANLMELDYPRLRVLVVSDASTDGTDEIVARWPDERVDLLRAPRRQGKTANEHMAAAYINSAVVVNTDASIRLHPHSVRHLVARLADPTVGVASGRDVSIGRLESDANAGESGYVGYEMAIRAMETRVSGIVGASGCLYAIRTHLHRAPLPGHLSRDFASALLARRAGFRAVSVDEAICYVPRAPSLQREYRRKVRTIARGMETLYHMRELMNPLRHGAFAWMLLSHKVCRWAAPWAAAIGLIGVVMLAPAHPWALALTALGLVGAALGVIGWMLPGQRLPRLLALPAFLLAGNIAAMHAFLKALRGERAALWEPTRREVAAA